MPNSPVTLQFCGAAQLRGGDGPPQRLERRDAALLLRLAVGGAWPRRAAALWLWPEQEPAQAQNSLRQRLFRLRKRWGERLLADQEPLRLAEGVRHDAGADEASPDAELLAGLDFSDLPELHDWLDALRSARRAQMLQSLADQAEAHEAAGRLAEALKFAQALTAREPCSEHAQRRVMRLHYRRGDRTAALTAFGEARARLREQLGVEPGAETLALAALIERSGELPQVGAAPLRPAVPPSLRRPPLLIGREGLWAALAQAQACMRPVLLEGEPGIGKTRLALDFAGTLAGAQVLKAHPAQAHTPYALLAAALAQWPLDWAGLPEWAQRELCRLLPGRGEGSDERLVPAVLARAVFEALQQLAGARPLPLVLDDLQWADAASLECLLAAIAGGAPVWPLFTLRLGEAVPAVLQAWRAADLHEVSDERHAGLQRLTVGPLARACLPTFLASLNLDLEGNTALTESLWRQCGGQPLAMLECLRHRQVGETTQPLLARVQLRLGTLSAAALRLLRVAALMGPVFSLARSARALGVSVFDLAEPLAELQGAHLMDGEGLAFDLAQEAALAHIPQALAPLLHAAVAEVLETDGVAPGLVAPHWQAAGDWARAAAAFEAAAALARTASRRVEELGFLDEAVAAHERRADGSGLDAAFDCRCLGVRAALFVGTEAQALAARMQALARGEQTPAQRLRVLVLQARERLMQSAGHATLEPARTALALARDLGDVSARLQAAGYLACALVMVGEAEAGLALLTAEQAVLAAAPAGSVDVMARLDFAGSRGYALVVADRPQEGVAPLSEAVELALRLGDHAEAAEQLSNLAIALSRLGRRADELACMERQHQLWLRMNRPGGVGSASGVMHMATAFAQQGRFAEALDLLHWALREFIAAGSPVWRLITEHRLARYYLRLGQLTRARQQLGALPPEADLGHRLARVRIQALLEAADGRSPWRLLSEAEPGADAVLEFIDRCMFDLSLVQFAEPQEAVRRAQALLGRLGGSALPARLSAGIRLADAWRRAGDGAAAARTAREWLAHWPQHEALDIDRLEFAWLACQALRAGGEESAAEAVAGEARGWISSVLPQVPEPYRQSFQQRNPAVVGFLTWRKEMQAA